MKKQLLLTTIISTILLSCSTNKPTTAKSRPVMHERGMQQHDSKSSPNDIYMSSMNELPTGNYYIVNVKSGLAIQGASTGATATPLKPLQKGDALQVFKVQKTGRGYKITMAGSSNLQFICLCAGGHNAMMISNESKEMVFKLIPAGSRSWYLSYLPEMGNFVIAQKTYSVNYTDIWLGAQLKNEIAEWMFLPAKDLDF